MGNDSPLSSEISPLFKAFTIAKEILPWLISLYTLIFGFGVKQSTSDHNLQMLMEDHATLEQLRNQQNESVRQQAGIAAKVDMLVAAQYQQGPHAK